MLLLLRASRNSSLSYMQHSMFGVIERPLKCSRNLRISWTKSYLQSMPNKPDFY
jgi:hypothetical protein